MEKRREGESEHQAGKKKLVSRKGSREKEEQQRRKTPKTKII